MTKTMNKIQPPAGRTVLSIRSTISGTYTASALSTLMFPIAWSGTTAAETRGAEESALADLVEEAREALRADPDAVAVEIRDGEVISTIHSEHE